MRHDLSSGEVAASLDDLRYEYHHFLLLVRITGVIFDCPKADLHSTSVVVAYAVAVLAGNGTYTTTASAAPTSTTIYTRTVHNTSYISVSPDSLANQTFLWPNATSTRVISIIGNSTSTQSK